MTANQFRGLALKIPGAVESAHMDHPDFRIQGKIFATLGYPDKTSGMVKLSPEQQQDYVTKAPEVFKPCSGVWGKRGATNVDLVLADESLVRAAMEIAAQSVIATIKETKRPSLHKAR
jgi:hypothetical protein